MGDRIACCVPFCRRTTGKPFKEWICARHWSVVPRSLRAELTAAKRQAKKITARKPLHREWWKYPAGSADRLSALGMWRRLDRIWDRCKTAAIETAGGI